MTVMRAKMRLESVQSFETCEMLKFHAIAKSGVYPKDGTDENNTFAKWTPTADLNMTITNPDLFGKIRPGDTFYVDFSKVE
jgi:hypothetical protein